MANIQEADSKKTPLHYCAERGHGELTQFLAEKASADINAADNAGWTPLHAACNAGQMRIVYYLLRCVRHLLHLIQPLTIEKGAKVHSVNEQSCIALNYFVRQCVDKNHFLTITCLSLLIPSPAHLSVTNNRSELSFLPLEATESL